MDWARRRRDFIFDHLGRVCKNCKRTKKLEFDVIIPVGNDDHHRKMSWDQRMRFYTRHFERNNLQVLCEGCNRSKKDRMELQATLLDVDEPF
jgi:hypothetical protein